MNDRYSEYYLSQLDEKDVVISSLREKVQELEDYICNGVRDLKIDAARWNWLASNCDGDLQDDFIQWLCYTVTSKEKIDEVADKAMNADTSCRGCAGDLPKP